MPARRAAADGVEDDLRSLTSGQTVDHRNRAAILELEIGFGWLRASRSALFRLLGNVRDLSGRSDLSPGANAK
jgi:hypothetical protein